MDQSCMCVCLLLSISVSSGEQAQQQNYHQNKINVHENLIFYAMCLHYRQTHESF